MNEKVVNYDGYDYDYAQYWKDREYENVAEHLVLEKMLKDTDGDWFIDIGGSYGRLADTYADRYKHCIILDYSLKTLKRNHEIVKQQYPNTTLIAANAYKMPFKDNAFDGGLMVRVLHHISRQKEYFTELSRILREDAIYIQEFANKTHIKARIRALLKRDKTILSKEPYQQPNAGNLEGAKGNGVDFLNYHPEYIEDLLDELDFDIEHKQGCSYLRIPVLKKILGTKLMIFFEKLFQKLLPEADISPSIFLETEMDKEETVETKYEKLEDILVCPECKHSLTFGENNAICDNCHKEYLKDGNIWDFRVK